MPENTHASGSDARGGAPLGLTRLIEAASSGDARAKDQLYERSYEELRGLAGLYMRRVPSTDTLQPTALVNEAYLRVASRENLSPSNSREFFGILSRAMQDIIVEQARKHGAQKRGEGWTRISVPMDDLSQERQELDVSPVALSEALTRLHETDPDLEELVRLRFFGGLGLRAVAQVLGVGLGKVRTDWDFARAWLRKELLGGQGTEHGPANG